MADRDREREPSIRSREASGDGRYAAQLALLADTYQLLRGTDLSELSLALAGARQRPTTYVGSGGALSVARLAAELHEVRTRGFARAATPLELIGMPPLSEHAVVLFSASARHPDAATAVTAALRGGAYPVVLVTHRERDELPASFDEVDVVTLPGVNGREGFLATNSVLSMSAALVAASDFKLPARLPSFKSTQVEPLRDETLILSGPGLAAVATDLETRLSETGLSATQLTDYRNFAHGRHTGLARRLDRTTIVALSDPPIEALAERTLSLLPDDAHIVRLKTQLTWPISTLDLLVASMKAIAPSAEADDFDPARPHVPYFGRKLYHLSSRLLISPAGGPVDRKLSALSIGGPHRLQKRYELALADWLDRFRAARFLGFVFDYDGTVCATDARYELPEPPIRKELLRLLSAGAILGFASGRGSSLYRDLREWIPQPRWQQVQLGLYNGGLALSLDQPLQDSPSGTGAVSEAARRMRSGPLARYVELSERQHQLGVTAHPGSGLSLDALAQMAQELISTPPALPLKATASGHSIDIIPTDSAKAQTLREVEAICDASVVAFGDQGQVAGNDFELLAATEHSLSVDRVSADPGRCWNLDDRGERGPDLLHRYLRSFQPLRDGFAFRPSR
jgi:hydroxymethylpyrimidine pyrophosphatase-like HAD family hydrolase